MINKYEAGQVVDIRFSNDSMPDRIFIDMVYKKPNSTEWMYNVLSEKKNGYTYMSESQISRLESKKTSKAYDNDIVKEMYEKGYRFCGNSNTGTCEKRARKLVDANYIKHIVLRSAVGSDGNIIPNQMGLWVQYNTVINNVECNACSDFIQMK